MFLAPLMLAAALQTETLVLFRGGPGDGDFRYWAVEDAFLDGEAPDADYGRDRLLSGGPRKTILVRFGDLERVVPPGKRILEARLVLSVEIGRDVALRRVGRLIAPWGEGPSGRGRFPRRGASAVPERGGAPGAATWRHRIAGPAPLAWQSAGAEGPGDSRPVEGATARLEEGRVVIEGLGPAVEAMRERPDENFGFALFFARAIDFASSEGPRGPRLELTLAPAPPPEGPDVGLVLLRRSGPDSWEAHVRAQGAVGPGRWALRVLVNGRPVGEPIPFDVPPPGEVRRVPVRVEPPRPGPDPRLGRLTVRVEGPGDADPANDSLTTFVEARPVFLEGGDAEAEERVARAVRWANEVLLPQSRFSFAPTGARTRFRFEGRLEGEAPAGAIRLRPGPDERSLRALVRRLVLEAGALDLSAQQVDPDAAPVSLGGVSLPRGTLDLAPGLTGGGDTRDDGWLPALPGLPYEPWRDPLFDFSALPGTDLLSATDVFLLDAALAGPDRKRPPLVDLLPASVLVSLALARGQRLPVGTTVELFRGSAAGFEPTPFLSVVSDARSSFVWPGRPDPASGRRNPFGALSEDGRDGLVLVRATYAGITEYAWIKLWQLLDARARGSVGAATLELRLNLADAPLDLARNLAAGRPVSDSSGSATESLAALVDDSGETVVRWEAGAVDWVEIDLGRDRLIGEVRLEPAEDRLWPSFEIRVYGTGQRPSEARVWAEELDAAWSLRCRRDVAPDGSRSLAYRGPATRARFVRLVPTRPGPAALRGVRIRGVTAEEGS